MQTPATLQFGAVRADGRLSLEAEQLHFMPFNQEFGLGPYHFNLDDIVSVTPCVAMGAGILPISRDAIKVICQDKTEYCFMLANSETWAQELSHLLEAHGI